MPNPNGLLKTSKLNHYLKGRGWSPGGVAERTVLSKTSEGPTGRFGVWIDIVGVGGWAKCRIKNVQWWVTCSVRKGGYKINNPEEVIDPKFYQRVLQEIEKAKEQAAVS